MQEIPIKIAEPEIKNDKPWNDDKLGRKKCADMLTSLLANQTAALTVSVNGEWGSGKTFLLKRWQQQLCNEGYKAIYFNAWEDDFMGDPLVAIIGQLRMCLHEDPNFKGLFKGMGATVFSLANGISKKIKGLDIEAASEKGQKAAKTDRDDILDTYDKLCQSRSDLKTTLEKMASQIFETTKKPLVFVIDELDRCRPTFAIETLERIKHFFNIDHIVFVLGIDRKQLGESIKSVYGNIDVENYLHRFIDLDFQLPAPDYVIFFNCMWDQHEISPILGKQQINGENLGLHHYANSFREFALIVLNCHNFSLREIQQLLKIFALVLRSSQNTNNPFHAILVLALIILKVRDKELYKKYASCECSHVDVMNTVLPTYKPQNNPFYLCCMAASIHASFAGTSEALKIERIETAIRDQLKGEAIVDASNFIRDYTACGGSVTNWYEAQGQSKRFINSKSIQTVIDLIDFSTSA